MFIHNLLEGLIICVLFMLSRLSRRGVVVLSIISSLSEFIGALLSHIFFKNLNSIIILLMILFVAGLMISLALNEILKEILLYNDKKYTLYGILLGILSYIIILLI
jgi:zinc transporter ZupT